MKANLSAILAVNFVVIACSHYYVLPFAQQSANRHMKEGPLIGWFYIVAATVVAVVFIYRFIKRKSYSWLAGALILSGTLAFFGIRFAFLICGKCYEAG